MKTLRMLVASLLLCGNAWAASPSSINNDDSCDVSVSPAATLLLPYFEVDATGTSGQTTIFTVTNVTRSPQIAHVTLWTDYGYPVLTFNLYLTGYDVQAINLADVLVRGVVAPPSGTTSATRPGQFSQATNPNLGASLDCARNPGLLPQGLVIAIRTALTTGSFSLISCEGIGASHTNAIGYATVDVVATCTDRTPSDPLYYTNDLLFDNVLIGDYQQIGPHPAGELASTFDAGGNPMVHIRAVPEGGGAGSNVDTALPYTFYDRYTPAARRTFDRRQPLPSTFASRFIQGGPAGFRTNLTVWRESAGSGSCTDAKFAAGLSVPEIVRFDEHENPFTFDMTAHCTCSVPPVYLPPTSSTSSSGPTYPPMIGNDVGGWFYLNLNNGGSTTRPSQNWVTVTMFGKHRHESSDRGVRRRMARQRLFACRVHHDPLNPRRPCRRNLRLSARHNDDERNDPPMQGHEHQPEAMKTLRMLVASLLLCGSAAAAIPSSINNDDSCDIKVGPAATLLLPYFEVDVNGTSGRTTLFTITNVTRYPQIAHVKLWSDWAYPVMTFNLFLTGYDIQAINLADVLIRGTVAPPSGTSQAATPGAVSANGNPNLRSPLDCANNPGSVSTTLIAAVRAAFTIGVFRPSAAAACNTMGGVHFNAIGYATIDVVANCTSRMPLDPLYYSTDLLFDNVLIGDYQQIGASPAGTGPASAVDAAGNPMVHIRAVPEGGGAGSDVPTALPYTFYDRYTPAANRTVDRRQPLPSTFAARCIQGGTSAFWTNATIWREALDGAGSSCSSYVNNSDLPIGESIRFDEHENASGFRNDPICAPCAPSPPTASATSSTNTVSSTYPSLSGIDVGGWLYLNLNNGGSSNYSVTQDFGGLRLPTNRRTNLTPIGSTPTIGPRPSQNWVTVTMFGNAGSSRMTAEFDAAPLGNGCSPAAFQFATNWFFGGSLLTPIAPAGGAFVCPPGTTLTNGTTTLCTGTNVNPIP